MKIADVKAAGYSIIVEMLNESEITTQSVLILPSKKEDVSNHAYIKDIGPLVVKDCGVKVGDLVLLQSQFVPVPNPDPKSTRKWGSVEMHAIKAIVHLAE